MSNEDDIREELGKWKRLPELLPTMIAEVAGDGRLLYVNRAACEITGRSREELLSMNVVDLVPHEDREYGRVQLEQALGEEDLGLQLRRIAMPDGRIREGIAQFVTVDDPKEGKTILACFIELEDPHQLARQVHISREFYEGLAESGVGLLCRFSSQARAVYANDALCQAMGRDKQELMGRSPFEFTHPEDVEQAYDAWQRAVEKRCAVHGEFRISARDDWLWVEWVLIPVFDVRGHLLEMQSVGYDVTPRRLVQAQLERERSLLEAVVENSPYAVAVVDVQGNVVLCNQALEEMIGTGRGENLLALSPGQGRTLSLALGEALEGKRVRRNELWLTPPETPGNSHRICLNCLMTPLLEADEKRRVVVLLRDVTLRVRARIQLAQARRNLMAAREQERRSLASELHDSVGQGIVAAQLAVQNAGTHPDPASARELRLASQTLERLVQEVRQISYGLYPPGLESLGLWPSLEQLARFAEGAGISVKLRCDPELEKRRLGANTEIALFRIAQEAVHNVTRHSRAGTMNLELGWEGANVLLRVKDNGVGFDAEDATLAGLGLNTMRDRASAVGGRLEIRSRPGRTEILAELPDPPDNEHDLPLSTRMP